MPTQFPKGSMGEQDQKNNKLAGWIVCIASIVVTAICYFLAAQPFHTIMVTPAWVAVPIAFVAWTAFVVYGLFQDSDFVTLSKVPLIVVIVLFFASMYVLFHQPIPM